MTRGALAAAAACVAACGGAGAGGVPADVTLAIDWGAPARPLSPALLGHNTVWSRGGLGLWDDALDARVAAAETLVRGLAPGLLRFPGGTRAMRYHFGEAIGPVAARVPQCDAFTGLLDDTTWGPDEFLAFAEELGAQVTWVAPWVDGSPEETAALVAYLNADPASTVVIGVDAHGKDWGTAGEWAARRLANGHAAPYRVRFLEVGNEPYLSQSVGPSESCGRAGQFRQSERWVGGVAIPTTAADYAAQLVATAELVRAIDPEIRIGAAAFSEYDGETDAATEIGDVDERLGTGDAWNARLVADAATAAAFDFFVLHPYDFGVTDGRLGLAGRLAVTVADLRRLAPGKGLAVTEFGFLVGGGTLMNALVSADMVRAGAELGLELVARHILIEDDPSGPFAESAAILGPERTRMPGYLAAELIAGHVTGDARPASSPAADLGVLATSDAPGGALAIVLVDRSLDGTRPRRVALPLPPGVWDARATTISAPFPDSGPGEIELSTTELGPTQGAVVVEVPPLSIVGVTLLAAPR